MKTEKRKEIKACIMVACPIPFEGIKILGKNAWNCGGKGDSR